MTISERVQIGVTYGVGIGWYRGNYDVVEIDAEAVYSDNPPFWRDRLVDVIVTETRSQVPAKDLFLDGGLDFVPLGKIEAAVAVILAPGLKVLASGGFNFPATQVFSFSVVYLIGT